MARKEKPDVSPHTRPYYLLLILIAGVMLIFSSATMAQIQQALPPQQTQATPPATGTPGNINTYYSRGALIIAIFALAVVTILFLLLLKYQHRLEQSGYLVQIYKDSVEENEFKRLSSDKHERFTDGYYYGQVEIDAQWQLNNPKPDMPSIPQASRATQPPGVNRNPSQGAYLYAPAGSDAETVAAVNQYNDARRKWEASLNAEARRRYEGELAECKLKAANRAENAVGNVDFSALQGRGAEFVLGFTTIASIVFAALALGVLKILNSEQIGTLFAAIAGYVLGRATARGSQAVQATQPTSAQPATPPVTDKLEQKPQSRAAAA